MIPEQGKVKDPVCLMQVDPDQYAIDYLGMHFAFCSQQCQGRFLANPHAYIGIPGEKAPKQEGRKVIKRRHLRLAEPLSDEEARQVIEHLMSMMGVYSVHAQGCELQITYDLLQATAAQLEATLVQAGAHLGEGWGEKLRRAFVHYLEETEVQNLEVRAGSGGHEHGGPHHHG
ncbi:MAG: YHS domain-containing protein [Gammaproteobacteria bacterium]|nr:YHS domain-containing protein [Gammaproteobacteria bacterium]